MEITTDDDPDLISLSSISDSTEHTTDSNLSFQSVAIMLTSAHRRSNRKGLGATAPSKKNNKTKTKPVKKEPVDEDDIPPPHEEVEEVPAPAIV